MRHSWRRRLYWLTRILVILAVILWVFTILGWLITDPGFEPVTAIVSAAVTGLAGASGWLGKSLEDVSFTVSSSNIGLSDGGIKLDDSEFYLAPEITLSFRASVCVHNSGSPVSVKLRIASMGPHPLSNCLLEGIILDDIDLEVWYKKQPNWAAIDLGNPFIAESGDRHIEIRAKIPFSVAKIEQYFGALGTMNNMTLALEANFGGSGVSLAIPSLSFDLGSVHNRIETDVVEKIPKYPVRSNRPLDTGKLVLALKRYWKG